MDAPSWGASNALAAAASTLGGSEAHGWTAKASQQVAALMLATFDAQEVVPEGLKVSARIFPRGTEGVLHGTSDIRLPVAIPVGPIRPRAFEDRLGDLFAGVAGYSHPNRNVSIQPRGIDRTEWSSSFRRRRGR